MYAHGFSEAITGSQRNKSRGTGVYDAVYLAATLPYVDKNKIGATGHSFGGRSINWSMQYDNKLDNPLISAILLQAADATYIDSDTKQYFNDYGSRDVGIIAADYDEFFFREKKTDGTTSKPREFLSTNNAQSFLHFGSEPGTFTDARTADTVYTQEINGKEARRVIYSLPMVHTWVPFSAASTAKVADFFDMTLKAPTPIPASNQVWQYKEIFNAIGLVAFAIFLVACTNLLLTTPFFSPLCAARIPEATEIPVPDRTWIWGGLAVSAIFSTVAYMALYQPVQDLQPGFRTQYPPLFIGIWAAVTGLFAILHIAALYYKRGKRAGFDYRAAGVTLDCRRLWLTVALAVLVIVLAYSIVFSADFFFITDFRLWVFAIKPFSVDRFPFVLKMLPLFLLFYIPNSVALNCFNRFTVCGKEWLNTFILALFNASSGIAILLLQYGTFFTTGEMNPLIQAMQGIYMIPIAVMLFMAAIITRKIYRVTGNPYLGGLIVGIAVTLITIANTQTLLF
jgi:hypothetical protein